MTKKHWLPYKNKKKCALCLVKYPTDATFHEMRLGTLEGTQELEICEECARFFDVSAEALQNRKKTSDKS